MKKNLGLKSLNITEEVYSVTLMEFEREDSYKMNENKDQKRNYYDVLGVAKDATEDMIKKAYKKLAMKWHPDKHKTEVKKLEAEVKFKELGEAYTTLSDPSKRRMYDMTNGSNYDDIPEFDFDFEDIDPDKPFPFEKLREKWRTAGGKGRGGGRPTPQPEFKQPDYNELFNNFLREQEKNFFENNQAFNPANLGDNHPFGKENPFANPFFTQNMPKFSFGNFNFPQPPNPFGGGGGGGSFTTTSSSSTSSSSSSPGSSNPNPNPNPNPNLNSNSNTTCDQSAGSKREPRLTKNHSEEKTEEKRPEERKREKDLSIVFEIEFQIKDLYCGAKRKLTYKATIPCKSCLSGKSKSCIECSNSGEVKGERVIIAEIPSGMPYEGTKIFPQAGHYNSREKRTGDLLIKIKEPKVSKYPEYSREGDDLIYHKEIQLCDLLCGSPIYVESLDDKEFSYTEKEMIRDGGSRRFKGRGFPSVDPFTGNTMSASGDLVVKYKVVFPTTIYTGQKAELLKSILPHEVYDEESEDEE